jgi:hypothetical protein
MNPTRERTPWQTPRLRRVPARDAQMPVGKADPGSDGISMS